MFNIPAIAFWVLLFVGREELGLRGIAIAIAAWGSALFAFAVFDIPSALFVTVQAVIDIVLVLIVFGGDVKFR